MKAFYRWMFHHQKLAMIGFSVFLCGSYTALLWFFHAPVWLTVVTNLLLIFITYCTVSSSALKLLKYADEALQNQCDPYLLLKETEELLPKIKSDPLKQVVLIDYSAALSFIGEYQKAYDVLKEINIDKYASTSAAIKAVYYHNLASLCTELNDFETANLWYQKSEQLYVDLTNPKQKSQLDQTMRLGKVEDCIRKNEYDQAWNLLEEHKPKSKLEFVNHAFLAAKVLIAKGNREQARKQLQIVIANGNKTYSVTEAKTRLEQL